MIFEGCKGAKMGKNYIITQQPQNNPSKCYFRDSKTASLFITNKKKREKTQKISYFLLKTFAVSNKSSTFAVHLRNSGYSLARRNQYIQNVCSLT